VYHLLATLATVATLVTTGVGACALPSNPVGGPDSLTSNGPMWVVDGAGTSADALVVLTAWDAPEGRLYQCHDGVHLDIPSGTAVCRGRADHSVHAWAVDYHDPAGCGPWRDWGAEIATLQLTPSTRILRVCSA